MDTMDPEEDCRQYWPETAFAKKVFLHSIVEAGKREEELEKYYHVCESKDILHSCAQNGHTKVFKFSILPSWLGLLLFFQKFSYPKQQQENVGSREKIERKRKDSKNIKNGDPWGPFSPNLRINGLKKLK